MLKPILTLLFIILLIQAESQTKVVKRFHWLQPSLVKEMPVPNLDQNEKKCAVIKVIGNPAASDFDFGVAGKAIETIKKSDVTWLWVPAGANAITVSNNKMGVICTYDFGQILEVQEVYELELYTIKEKPKGDLHSITQRVNIMDKYSLGADFYIDNEFLGKTPYFGSLPIGDHNLRMELNGKKKDTTITVVKDNTLRVYGMNFKLSEDPDDIKKAQNFTQPQFPGGYEQLMKFLGSNIKYPALAQESGIEGIVYVSFVVRETGRFSNLRILRGIFPACDEEVIRVIKMMPKWSPGLNKDKMAVPAGVQLPVAFKLAKK
jgi:TonB family protein